MSDEEDAGRSTLEQAPFPCQTCGYNLTGLPERRCPECGQPFDVEALAARRDRLASEYPGWVLAISLLAPPTTLLVVLLAQADVGLAVLLHIAFCCVFWGPLALVSGFCLSARRALGAGRVRRTRRDNAYALIAALVVFVCQVLGGLGVLVILQQAFELAERVRMSIQQWLWRGAVCGPAVAATTRRALQPPTSRPRVPNAPICCGISVSAVDFLCRWCILNVET